MKSERRGPSDAGRMVKFGYLRWLFRIFPSSLLAQRVVGMINYAANREDSNPPGHAEHAEHTIGG